MQSLSGTGALRLGAELLNKQMGRTVIYYSLPTWGNYICATCSPVNRR